MLDPLAKTVRRGEREIALTAKEFMLLAYLMANPGVVVSPDAYAQQRLGDWLHPGTKVVDVYIRYLRRKIDAAGENPLIRTVRGFGYVISA